MSYNKQMGTNFNLAQKVEIALKKNDIIIGASDGFFDNIWPWEILNIINNNCNGRRSAKKINK